MILKEVNHEDIIIRLSSDHDASRNTNRKILVGADVTVFRLARFVLS